MEKLKLLIAFAISASIILFGANLKSNKIKFEKDEISSSTTSLSIIKNKDQKILESVIQIEIYESSFGELEMKGTATGFSVKNNSDENFTLILTNNHVCDNALNNENFSLSYLKSTDPIPDFRIHENRTLEIIKVDPLNDLCLVKASNEFIPTVKFESSSNLQVLENIYSIGAPEGVFPIWIEGKYSGELERSAIMNGTFGRNFMLLSTTILHGQSGSPVYNENGRVVGIVFATLGGYGGVATPSDSILEFLEESI